MSLELARAVGNVTFSSSDPVLDQGFRWARDQALAYAHHGGDPVGLWYEAALPERNAFCMRDVAHQAIGAAVLGLQFHNRNMLYKFAESISDSRDWCSYWEIDKADRPAPVDYTNDADFWYNLPANFDVLDACYRQFLWTGDTAYVNDPVFENFYLRSVNDYVKRWDKNGDGVMEHYMEYGRRGIASYNEVGLRPLAGGDMLGAQYAGYRAFANLAALKGDAGHAKELEQRAQKLQEHYENAWWNQLNNRFYGALLQNLEFYSAYYAEGNFLPLYFGIVHTREKLKLALNDLMDNGVPNVEAKTYLPDIYYKYGLNEHAYRELLELIDPSLKRREYPEVSYTVVGGIAMGLMGIHADGKETISTVSRLVDSLEWAQIQNLPILQRIVHVEHRGRAETRFTNVGQSPVYWKAIFPYKVANLLHDEQVLATLQEKDEIGNIYSFVVVKVNAGETSMVRLTGDAV